MAVKKLSKKSSSSNNPNKDYQTGTIWLNIDPAPKKSPKNKDDHNVVANLLVNVKDDIIHLHQKLDHLDDQVDKVDDKIDVHLKSHRGK